MQELSLSVGEPFTSPAWGANFVVFAGDTGRPLPEPQTKDYISRCCKYARQHNVWLVPERFILMGYQCMSLINPEGKVLGAQKAMFGGPVFRSIAKRSSLLELFRTEFGGVFLCVDVDVYRPEVAKVASNMGAQIIICSQSVARGDYGSHMVLTGAWNAAQLAGAFVIAVSNQFNCVCAPTQLSPAREGFINLPGIKLPMTAKISADRLEDGWRPKPLTRKLYAIHRGELIG
ncbi:MAG: hypothetical protein FWE32_06725 [Oscillospiraceae bacterium]|nr:hypothetical protein [Oscillospiraceae bacterium]